MQRKTTYRWMLQCCKIEGSAALCRYTYSHVIMQATRRLSRYLQSILSRNNNKSMPKPMQIYRAVVASTHNTMLCALIQWWHPKFSEHFASYVFIWMFLYIDSGVVQSEFFAQVPALQRSKREQPGRIFRSCQPNHIFEHAKKQWEGIHRSPDRWEEFIRSYLKELQLTSERRHRSSPPFA